VANLSSHLESEILTFREYLIMGYFIISTKQLAKNDYRERGFRYVVKWKAGSKLLINLKGIVRLNKKSKVLLFKRNTTGKCFNRYDFRNLVINVAKRNPIREIAKLA
jgi:hypothetical protein